MAVNHSNSLQEMMDATVCLVMKFDQTANPDDVVILIEDPSKLQLS